jgi:hypothetical protein
MYHVAEVVMLAIGTDHISHILRRGLFLDLSPAGLVGRAYHISLHKIVLSNRNRNKFIQKLPSSCLLFLAELLETLADRANLHVYPQLLFFGVEDQLFVALDLTQ